MKASEIVYTTVDPGQFLAFKRQQTPKPVTDRQVNSIEAVILQELDGKVLAELDTGVGFYAEFEYTVDIPVEMGLRQSVFGDAVSWHSPKLRHHFEDFHFVSEPAQVIGG